MNKPTLKIDNFCKYYSRKYSTYNKEKGTFDFDYSRINIIYLSLEFCIYFDLDYPTSIDKLLTVCNNSGIKVNFLNNDHQSRGYNFSYGDDVHIFIKENDSPTGKIHTLLHELYEIIDDKLYSYSNNGFIRDRKVIEAKADQFSSQVHVPYQYVFDWVDIWDVDVFGLKKFLNCSYVTALTRMNDVLCNTVLTDTKKHIPVIGILYERPYWKETPNGEIPELQFKFFTKSKGFPFSLSRTELDEVIIYSDFTGDLPIIHLIKTQAKYRDSILFRNVEMIFKNNRLTVDVLIRTVNWKCYDYTAKVLMQIMPSDHSNLRELAGRLLIGQINLGKEEYDSSTLRKSFLGEASGK